MLQVGVRLLLFLVVSENLYDLQILDLVFVGPTNRTPHINSAHIINDKSTDKPGWSRRWNYGFFT